MKEFFASQSFGSSAYQYDFSSLGDKFFLPLTHVSGSIHASQLPYFREKFVSFYLSNLSFFRSAELYK